MSRSLDLRGVPCPENSAKALLEMELMEVHQVIELKVDDGEPIENLPASLEQFGHKILTKEKLQANFWVVLVEVGE